MEKKKTISVIYPEEYEPIDFEASGSGISKENLKMTLKVLLETLDQYTRDSSFNFKIEIKEQ